MLLTEMSKKQTLEHEVFIFSLSADDEITQAASLMDRCITSEAVCRERIQWKRFSGFFTKTHISLQVYESESCYCTLLSLNGFIRGNIKRSCYLK